MCILSHGFYRCTRKDLRVSGLNLCHAGRSRHGQSSLDTTLRMDTVHVSVVKLGAVIRLACFHPRPCKVFNIVFITFEG